MAGYAVTEIGEMLGLHVENLLEALAETQQHPVIFLLHEMATLQVCV
jgi:hypothetical protein